MTILKFERQSDQDFDKAVQAVATEFSINYHDVSGTMQQMIRALAATRHQLGVLQFNYDMERLNIKEKCISALQSLSEEAWTKPWTALVRAIEKIRTL